MPYWYFVQDFNLSHWNDGQNKFQRLRILFLDTNSLLCSHNEWDKLTPLERYECREMWYGLPDKHVENPSHLKDNYPPRDTQLESDKDDTIAWVLVVGHHPLFSRGPHGTPNMLNKYLRPLFQMSAKVVAYFAGHNHGLEHYIWDRYNNWDHAEKKINDVPSHPKKSLFHTFLSGASGVASLHDMKGEPPEQKDSSLQLGYLGKQVYGFMSVSASPQSILVQTWDEFANEVHSVVISTR
ncbi:hypothetical protein RFI_14671 [Reticulomyxa filosa]|uniref:Calcineurin-like phosphoesterase domain-containing protein n=1 Tax=Reticulomyxa filosa TaxID=46433 RepID=X6N905_RETFI|nr:hypothetical protein RFI_14671 [Reticulomyxa filosa]|eukprot:ETO22526.1 hypothetical protein RFI_14671 [Reticulomyxa filosa]